LLQQTLADFTHVPFQELTQNGFEMFLFFLLLSQCLGDDGLGVRDLFFQFVAFDMLFEI
jgi:hypothetical protein